jgi:hypothetical protein
MKIIGQVKNGKLEIGDYNRRLLNDFLKDKKNQGRKIAIQDRAPESRQQRAYYHGAVLSLWAYLNGMDYRDGDVMGFLHEHAKKEFNGEIVTIDGKQVLRGKSTVGLLSENDQANSGYIDRVVSYLEENYGIDRNKLLNPEHYKQWRDEIYSFGEHDSYIEYLQAIGLLK